MFYTIFYGIIIFLSGLYGIGTLENTNITSDDINFVTGLKTFVENPFNADNFYLTTLYYIFLISPALVVSVLMIANYTRGR